MYSLKDLVVLEHPNVLLRNERSQQVGSEAAMIFGTDDETGVVEQACDNRVLIVAVLVQHRRRLQTMLVVIDQIAERRRISGRQQELECLPGAFLSLVDGTLAIHHFPVFGAIVVHITWLYVLPARAKQWIALTGLSAHGWVGCLLACHDLRTFTLPEYSKTHVGENNGQQWIDVVKERPWGVFQW